MELLRPYPAIFLLLFYSLYCDPLWSVVHGIGRVAAFAVVAFGGLELKTVLVRCAALGSCVILLILSGAAEYMYTLTRYTARIYFPGSSDRPQLPDLLASQLFYSPYMKYFTFFGAVGWLLGVLMLSGRAHVLVVTGIVSCFFSLGYSLLYLLLNVPWLTPLPLYLEHGLFAASSRRAVIAYFRRAGPAAQRFGVPMTLQRAMPPNNPQPRR